MGSKRAFRGPDFATETQTREARLPNNYFFTFGALLLHFIGNSPDTMDALQLYLACTKYALSQNQLIVIITQNN